MKTCSKCGKEIEDSAKFCPECGAASDSDFNEIFYSEGDQAATKINYCPKCHLPIEEGMNFCSYCGYKVNEPLNRPQTVSNIPPANSYVPPYIPPASPVPAPVAARRKSGWFFGFFLGWIGLIILFAVNSGKTKEQDKYTAGASIFWSIIWTVIVLATNL
jgi:hypothetical protein